MATDITLKLTAINYGGKSIGREWDFVIKANKTETKFSRNLTPGMPNPEDREVFKETGATSPVPVSVMVTAVEKDKVMNDTGTATQSFTLSADPCAASKDLEVKVSVFEDDDKKKDEAMLTFIFKTNGPPPYQRNYEEQKGVDPSPGPKKNQTTEDFFIVKDRGGALPGAPDRMNKIVKEYQKAIDQIQNQGGQGAFMQTNTDFGRKILARARAMARANDFAIGDDRVLYWARLKMIVALKSHPIYACASATTRDQLVRDFEEASRGYKAVDFGPAGSMAKVLVTGFDPFEFNFNIRQSNPSGAISLALHGLTIAPNAKFPKGAYIQSMIFPVRYRDFQQDKGPGIVEEAISPFVNGAVDLILTCSQTGKAQFEVDRFPSRFRGLGDDNEGVTQAAGQISSGLPGDEFYETTLPVDKIVPASGKNFAKYPIYFDQEFKYADKTNGAVSSFPEKFVDGPQKVEEASHPLHAMLKGKVPSELDNINPPLKSNIMASLGSGGDYLSNEIHYRVSRMRTLGGKPTLPSGHYHVPFLQPTGTDLNKTKTATVIKRVRDTIQKAVN
ncbi:MAG: hypothetical protein H6581_03110 [Bacteroidia bacterium]|nr:hypothetical protein [Bacteroidia bacterium]